MNILVVGGGGREHALAWKIRQSPLVDRCFVAPGNGGIAQEVETAAVAAEDIRGLARLAKEQKIDLTIVGPEAPLAAGLVDGFASEGLLALGPGAEAARLESSKTFAKKLMHAHNIPTASHRSFDDLEKARHHLASASLPVVVKADGLAAGKGVFVCVTREEALEALAACMVKKAFGAAGERVVVEECLLGSEASALALTDGETLYSFPLCRDFKRLSDGDRGPNTGGMGAFCSSGEEIADRATLQRIDSEVLVPMLHALRVSRLPFRGVLYAGLMFAGSGPKVLEFNVRFGDPEVQPLLVRLSSDLVPLFLAASGRCRWDEVKVRWDPRPSVCVVLAAGGYPAAPRKGMPIAGLEEASRVDGVQLFHSGTAYPSGRWEVAGGRVLGVTALGEDLSQARKRAYEAVSKIDFDGMQFRSDIALKASMSEKTAATGS
jgi:phosphoribosylamine--glycine ligase